MGFQFKIQDYQTDAVESTVAVFNGQSHQDPLRYRMDLGSLTLGKNIITEMGFVLPNEAYCEDDFNGFRNAPLELNDQTLLDNIHNIQNQNQLKQSATLSKTLGGCSLDIEMETGTGKTYVYIKTIFEMHKRFGWTKYIVVVPSIAIREGVKRTFQDTVEHFREEYHEVADFFVYDSSDLRLLDEFARNPKIAVMIINTQAFAASLDESKNKEGRGGDKAARIIYTEQESFGSRRPIDVIRQLHPILILDEPQKMGGDVTRRALANFQPLFSLNYSATHKDTHNPVYVLDALDAYNKRLVKKIEVKGFEIRNFQGLSSYIYLDRIVLDGNSEPRASIEFEVSHQNGVKRERHTLSVGDDLYAASNQLEQYRHGFRISNIDARDDGWVSFDNGNELHLGKSIGDISEEEIRRLQIRETIKSHFDKEEQLFKLGIKTLSLFFIDEVSKYRLYDDDDNEILGEYGRIFEEEYNKELDFRRTLFQEDAYQQYLNEIDTHETHKGYFSIDNKGHACNGTLKRGSDSSDDVSAYELIMKRKDLLVSLSGEYRHVRFIFSHSALREGWDNPNIFQICTLRHTQSTIQKRQEVGRGLRICVNDDLVRMDKDKLGDDVHRINRLTVIASEDYATFVNDLQNGIKEVLYDRPTTVTASYFIGKSIRLADGTTVQVTEQQANRIYKYLVKNDYVDDDNKVADVYHEDLKKETLAPLPEDLAPMADGIHKLIQGVFDEKALAGMFDNGNKPEVQRNDLNANFGKPEFQALWNQINHQYAYTVTFDSEQLIANAVESIDKNLHVSSLEYTFVKGEQKDEMNADDVKGHQLFVREQTETYNLKPDRHSEVKYDLIGKITEGTKLTRRSVAAILTRITPFQFAKYKLNPEEFIAKVIKLINIEKGSLFVECIAYNQTEQKFESTIFTSPTTKRPYSDAERVKKGIQPFVFVDGSSEESVERNFARELETASEVCVYAKLPKGRKGFFIPTPVGDYSPDWAIAFNNGTVKHIYFIAETKGSLDSLDLRRIEEIKIECARKIFNQLSLTQVRYDVVKDYHSLLEAINNLKN
ncbi:MAG: DEAD/DEAH box helicase family protein [Victivallales bacterium]|nr:DEAD/DEAH box helicase family protein [Victivallales bacterium]